jgi:hypothetical protein
LREDSKQKDGDRLDESQSSTSTFDQRSTNGSSGAVEIEVCAMRKAEQQ